MLAGLLALVVAATFSGAAVYITIAEQPARLALDDRALLAEWQPAYKHGLRMQVSLIVLGFVLGAIAWWLTGNGRWLLGAVILGANVPYTLIGIRPTNDRLMATAPTEAGPATRALITHWGRLHAVRSGLGFAATLVFLWAALT